MDKDIVAQLAIARALVPISVMENTILRAIEGPWQHTVKQQRAVEPRLSWSCMSFGGVWSGGLGGREDLRSKLLLKRATSWHCTRCTRLFLFERP